jgi:hypothetical protein
LQYHVWRLETRRADVKLVATCADPGLLTTENLAALFRLKRNLLQVEK